MSIRPYLPKPRELVPMKGFVSYMNRTEMVSGEDFSGRMIGGTIALGIHVAYLLVPTGLIFVGAIKGLEALFSQ